jgi:Mn2+/Fe2+ NRAMP family transporter
LQVIVLLLFLANTINVGADLSGMADSATLLLGGPAFVYVIAFGLICILGIVFVHYDDYVMVLKWLTLSLFAYVAALFAAEVPWGKAIYGALVPPFKLEQHVPDHPRCYPRHDNRALLVLLASSITPSNRRTRDTLSYSPR